MHKKIIAALLLLALLFTLGCLSLPTIAKPEICEKIVNGNTKDNCYWESATRNRDADLCQKIIDSNSRDLCYKDVAVGDVHWNNAAAID